MSSEKLNSVPAVLGCAAIRLSTLHPHTRTRDQQLTWVKLKNRKLRSVFVTNVSLYLQSLLGKWQMEMIPKFN